MKMDRESWIEKAEYMHLSIKDWDTLIKRVQKLEDTPFMVGADFGVSSPCETVVKTKDGWQGTDQHRKNTEETKMTDEERAETDLFDRLEEHIMKEAPRGVESENAVSSLNQCRVYTKVAIESKKKPDNLLQFIRYGSCNDLARVLYNSSKSLRSLLELSDSMDRAKKYEKDYPCSVRMSESDVITLFSKLEKAISELPDNEERDRAKLKFEEVKADFLKEK